MAKIRKVAGTPAITVTEFARLEEDDSEDGRVRRPATEMGHHKEEPVGEDERISEALFTGSAKS